MPLFFHSKFRHGVLVALMSGIMGAESLRAQFGDRPNDEAQRPPNPDWNVPAAPARSPNEALATFVLPPGFRVELVAAEPLVHDPAAMAFDQRGRLWITELSGYNSEILTDLPVYLDKTQPPPAKPVGRVVCLEDTDGDGRMDKRTVFLDNLEVPRAIGFYGDAVLVGSPPHLWLCRDRDGDGVADEKIVIADDYGTVPQVETSPNGLLWGRDNWLYNASYKWRFRPAAGQWRREPMPELGQWGITQDDAGRLFYNNNSDQLRGDFLPPHYAANLPRSTRASSFNVQIATDQQVFPIRPTPGSNRAYRKDFLRGDGSLVAFTAASAPLIYRGSQFPARFVGNAFVPEPAGNTIKRNLVVESEGRLAALNGYEQADFMSSTDERFRPVYLINGPDGALYVADMYRGILEGYDFITTFLRDQILKRGLQAPLVGMGRIYRIVHESGARRPLPDFARLDPAQRVALLSDANGWTRDTAQRAIVDSGDRAHAPLLEALYRRASSERDRLYALWCLDGLDAATPEIIRAALTDPAAKIRMAGLRLSEPSLGAPEGASFRQILSPRLPAEEPEVLAQALLSLATQRTDETRAMILAVLPRASEHPALLDAAILAVRGEESRALDHLLALAARGTLPLFGHRALCQSLGQTIVNGGDNSAHSRLTEALLNPKAPAAMRIALMQGVMTTVHPGTGRRAGPRVKLAAELVERIAAQAPDPLVRKDAQNLRSIIEEEKERLAKRVAIPPLTADQQKLYDLGKTNYLVCSACHQPNGEGKRPVAPPLVDARWAIHPSPEFSIRIVLAGKEGTPGYPGAMPPLAALSDEQIAGILTYIRRTWGNEASAVAPRDVAKVRAETVGRAAWTDAELEKLNVAK